MANLAKIFAVFLIIVVFVLISIYMFFFYYVDIDKPELHGDYVNKRIVVNEVERTYSAYIPSSLSAKADVIFILHGSNRTAKKIRQQTAYEFDVLAEKYGFVAVYPNAYKKHWNDCRKSALYASNQLAINDIQFIQEIIEEVGDANSVEIQKVYVMGFSNGGHMAYKIAMEVPQSISAIAVVGASLPVEKNRDCVQKKQAVSVAIFNGTKDPVNPYHGGLVKVGNDVSRGKVLSTDKTVLYWSDLAGVKSAPVITQYSQLDHDDETRVIRYQWDGADGKEILLYRLQGSGHVIPSKMSNFPRVVGPEARDISAAEEIVAFFLRR